MVIKRVGDTFVHYYDDAPQEDTETPENQQDAPQQPLPVSVPDEAPLTNRPYRQTRTRKENDIETEVRNERPDAVDGTDYTQELREEERG